MSSSQVQDQLVLTGSLISLTVFEQKLMRNFSVIHSRLKKLQSLNDIETKTRNIQKQLRFLTTKVDNITQKLPKDGVSISKKDVQGISKDQIFDILSNSQDKLTQTEIFKNIFSQIQKLKAQINRSGSKNSIHQGLNQKEIPQKQASFTAGTILLSESKKHPEPSKKLLNQVLTKQQSKYVNQIIADGEGESSQVEKVKKDIQKLYNIVDKLKVGFGMTHFVQKQLNQYERMERGDSKSNRKKKKSPNKKNQGQPSLEDLQKPSTNLLEKGSSKGQVSIEMQRNASKNEKSETIIKQDFLTKKSFNSFNSTVKVASTLLNKQQLSGVFINGSSNNSKDNNFPGSHSHFNKLGQLTKIQYIPESKLLSKAQRSKSLKKLQRVEKKLRVDDIKDINTVLKEIELRLQGKASQDIFTQFMKEFEQKLQILRITKDASNEISDLRKMVYNLDSKMQYVVTYLQATNNQDDGLIVKKNWTCISCDKPLQKFNAKTGQHLNWDSVQAKKISPTKIGAFGQTGQLASKIKNLMENQGGQ